MTSWEQNFFFHFSHFYLIFYYFPRTSPLFFCQSAWSGLLIPFQSIIYPLALLPAHPATSANGERMLSPPPCLSVHIGAPPVSFWEGQGVGLQWGKAGEGVRPTQGQAL